MGFIQQLCIILNSLKTRIDYNYNIKKESKLYLLLRLRGSSSINNILQSKIMCTAANYKTQCGCIQNWFVYFGVNTQVQFCIYIKIFYILPKT